MKNIYITGSRGLVASKCIELFKGKYNLITPEIEELDITDLIALKKYFENREIDVIINFAAMTDVDKAEKEKGNKKGLYWKVNVNGAVNLAKLGKDKKARMVQISTDFVLVDNLGWYAQTKKAAEKEIQKILDVAIVRIAFPFGNYKSPRDYINKLKTVVAKGYPIFSDQQITPTYIPDLAKALEIIIDRKFTGVFHVATYPPTTPFEIARTFAPDVKEGKLVDFLKRPGVAPRPINGGLDCKATQKKLGIIFHSWSEALAAET